METLKNLVDAAKSFIWEYPPQLPFLVVLLVGTGVFITFRMGWVQIRKFKHSLGVISGRYDDPADEGDITHFQALSAALSATVGIGNIAGVATAIHYGGPGALFWMWVTAIFGMALKYTECTLSHFYRKINPDGSASGGPMYYIEKGLGRRWKPIAILFAACAVISSFGQGNAIQAFTVADSFRADLGIPQWVTGLIMSSLVALVIIGGIKRIGKVASKLAPGMMIVYVTGAVIILLLNIEKVPGTFVLIFKHAFTPTAGIGGFAGATLVWTLMWGVKRGLFSNEAGQGSAPIAHAAAKTKWSVREGTVAMIGPFIDTLVVCTMTGLVIIIMGTWNQKRTETVNFEAKNAILVLKEEGRVEMDAFIDDEDRFVGTFPVEEGQAQGVVFVRRDGGIEEDEILLDDQPFTGSFSVDEEGTISIFDQNGLGVSNSLVEIRGRMPQHSSPLTAWSFQLGLKPILGNFGNYIVTLAVFLFALSTAISWSYYGDRSIQYLLGSRAIKPYKLVYCIVHFLGAMFSLEVVWGFGDAALGLMAIPNLIALIALSKTTAHLTKDYFSREHIPYKKQLERISGPGFTG
ncbi:sodium:alanine symporter family protein [candidate division KSB1 bacterium]|nr:sodium:alanine symporter family protein [candidate division KSB1 bacterium]